MAEPTSDSDSQLKTLLHALHLVRRHTEDVAVLAHSSCACIQQKMERIHSSTSSSSNEQHVLLGALFSYSPSSTLKLMLLAAVLLLRMLVEMMKRVRCPERANTINEGRRSIAAAVATCIASIEYPPATNNKLHSSRRFTYLLNLYTFPILLRVYSILWLNDFLSALLFSEPSSAIEY